MNKKISKLIFVIIFIMAAIFLFSGCFELVEDQFDSSDSDVADYSDSNIDDSSDSTDEDNVLISELLTGPKNFTMNFMYDSENWEFNFTIYQGFYDYLLKLPETISYDPLSESPPTTKDFILKKIDQEHHEYFLQPIVDMIQNFTNDTDDQARIAVSIVQNIPYDYDGLYSGNLTDKYPYEVIYTQSGVCGEKSNLLIYLLKELGFGAAALEFEMDNHRAVGIECPTQYSFRNTSYCFVESTTPSIITDSNGDNISAGNLDDCEVITISNGYSFDSVSEEYYDAIEYNNLVDKSEQNGGILSPSDYARWQELVEKYGILTE